MIFIACFSSPLAHSITLRDELGFWSVALISPPVTVVTTDGTTQSGPCSGYGQSQAIKRSLLRDRWIRDERGSDDCLTDFHGSTLGRLLLLGDRRCLLGRIWLFKDPIDPAMALTFCRIGGLTE
jgi:hypothetical protein